MAKISPLNYLYIICYNKEEKSSVIFGYTLTGLKFAKSKYGYYDNIDFTMNGNIVTLINHLELCILSGSNLAEIKKNKKDQNYNDYTKICDKVKNSDYLQFNYFIKEKETNYFKIITYYKDEGRIISTLDVTQNKYFD